MEERGRTRFVTGSQSEGVDVINGRMRILAPFSTAVLRTVSGEGVCVWQNCWVLNDRSEKRNV